MLGLNGTLLIACQNWARMQLRLHVDAFFDIGDDDCGPLASTK